ncbi:DNA mismatch repair protein MutS [Desulfallas thermosapovorans]|uniref:DNA mismatch repair protein MutS n=1 Tax=Desulfallas thermosapovorans DSM 6562 TaxID=1121431 RepID=A0A5S5A0G6_9FIRM|nr:DNA mismatch repair protein MutS [Desulfallas thermosapovorans]TYO97807.1 DNA mismatch repair protein MutS [Desulfallas thermosapovorans DSM 6562]
MAYTPMMQQYLQIKKSYQNHILMFRMGDFYEMFFDDALLASKELEIALTARDGGGGKKVPMCGVPHHAAQTYIARLIERGHRVAICEQTEDPRQAKGLVKREVTRIVTPGTLMEGQYLDDKKNNYLTAVVVEETGCGLAYSDISTGSFFVTQFNGPNAYNELIDEIHRLQPAELLLTSEANADLSKRLTGAVNILFTAIDDSLFTLESAENIINQQFGSEWRETGIDRLVLGLRAAGGILLYLMETQKRNLQQINRPQIYHTHQYMKIDAVSRRNLELTSSIRDGQRWGTLIWVLDYTCTAMGSRLLKLWIEQPLLDSSTIKKRLDAVEELLNNLIMRTQLRENLKQVYDLERLAGRVAYGSANARDLLALRKSFDVLPKIKALINNVNSELLIDIINSLDDMSDINELLHRALVDDPPVQVRDGGILKSGFHPEVDRLRAASRNGKDWLARLEAEERQRTGIKSLKVGFNKVFGYYLEVTKANLNQVPKHYIRRQTLVNAERFITNQLKEYEDMILGAQDRLVQLEYQLFGEIRQTVAGELQRIQGTAGRLAVLDVLSSLAESAQRYNFVRPIVNSSRKIVISDGRHPVVERVLKAGNFVPNDTYMDENNKLILLTGPNMAGKSTYMRQVALITLMAQMGSFVPAAAAEIGVVDYIFTRIGAADDLAGGRSTFMVEMSECRNIVNNATPNSLIIMDEVGRGTSTYDGISIARALVEYIHDKIGARTLFSTHYHELTDLEALPGVVNCTVSVHEENDEIIFLRKVLPGKVDKSYGIQVARLAGLPEEILNRAHDVLHRMEITVMNRQDTETGTDRAVKISVAGRCDQCPERLIIKELAKVDVMHITPMQALTLLHQWTEKLKDDVGLGENLLKEINISSEN